MIEISDLGRVYTPRRTLFRRASGGSEVVALDDFSLRVEVGRTHGLLGPNGAGKTTLVKILCTVLLPTSGRAAVAGFDVVRDAARVRREIGIVFGGDRGLYGRLTPRQNLRFWGAVAGLDTAGARRRADALLERVGLAERAGERVETFSRGMKQRLHLARGLIGDPSVIVLDEPTVGMDPVAAREVRALVGELRAERKTILLTTHDMVEAEQLCDQVTLIDHGRALFTEDPQRIGRLVAGHDRVEFGAPDAALAGLVSAELADLPGVIAVEPGEAVDGGTTWRVHATNEGLRLVLGRLVQHGITDISTQKPTLEQVYLHFIGDRGLKV
ncbi:ABC transporter ATP-binding protein [Planotetraspora sp. GP83]|uniref:ABC transporter ATP-binding protein n=1 Tax=Planotetraspora sp. GP83 TaxID=3156264 RepID=UPI0035125C86